MKNPLTSCAAAALLAGVTFTAAHAEEVKIGVLLGFTGPAESIFPPIAMAAELAIKEASDSGVFLNGSTIIPVRGDSTCTDNNAAVSAGERLVTADGVKAIMGAGCSGVTGAVIANVAVPHGIVAISPSATSPALSTAEDNGLFFRTAPSAAREGVVMAELLIAKGITEVALTYTNNDYGLGMSESFQGPYEALGGTITIIASHEDGKADYSAEVGALAAAGGDLLVLFGYLDQGGSGILQAALDLDAFDAFHINSSMLGDMLLERFGNQLDGTTGQNPGTDSPGKAVFFEVVNGAFNATGTFVPEGYDAAALIVLAMQSAGSSDSQVFKTHVMSVANAPGELIYPGELAKGLEILAAGGEIDYVGASGVELIGPGESAGNYREFIIENGEIITIAYH